MVNVQTGWADRKPTVTLMKKLFTTVDSRKASQNVQHDWRRPHWATLLSHQLRTWTWGHRLVAIRRCALKHQILIHIVVSRNLDTPYFVDVWCEKMKTQPLQHTILIESIFSADIKGTNSPFAESNMPLLFACDHYLLAVCAVKPSQTHC